VDVCRKSVKIVKHQRNVQIVVVKNVAVGGVSILIDYYTLRIAINAWKIRNELASKIGKGKYVLAEYEKIKRITMPLGDKHLLYVTTEVDADHSNVIAVLRKCIPRNELTPSRFKVHTSFSTITTTLTINIQRRYLLSKSLVDDTLFLHQNVSVEMCSEAFRVSKKQ
jgi:hypothetical protein